MSEGLTQNKRRDHAGNLLIAISCLVYFASYVMRYSYTVSMAHIIEVTSLTETQAGAIGTALFFAYGLGQVVSGILGDKLKPNLIISAGVLVGTVCNVVFPLYHSVVYYTAVWAINGFAQAMIWPPLVKILSDKLSPEKCSTGIVLVTAAANLATLILYLVIPPILSALDYKIVFYIAGGLSGLIGIIWSVGYAVVYKKKSARSAVCSDAVKQAEAEKNREITSKTVKILPLLWGSGTIFIMASMVMQGFLRDGITGWFPSYLSVTFDIPSADGILITAALSLTAIVSIYVFKWIYRRFCHNEITIVFVAFVTVAAFSLLLFFFSSTGIAFTVIFGALTVGISHGINLMLTMTATHFSRFGKASTVAGVVNACTYIGSALSMYLFALLAELAGWRVVVLTWVIIAALGAAACAAAYKKWKAFLSGEGKFATQPETEAKDGTADETEAIDGTVGGDEAADETERADEAEKQYGDKIA